MRAEEADHLARNVDVGEQPLEPNAIARRDGDLGVHVEALNVGDRLRVPRTARVHDP